MANRFTDTEKWKDEWFLQLEPVMKMFWIYMLDTCDYAGVWKVNFRLASYCINSPIDRQSALNALGDRIHVISLDKWHIPKFITFQYRGALSHSNNAHKGVLKLLKYHNIETSPYLVKPNCPEGHLTNSNDSLGSKDKNKDQEQDKDLYSSSLKEIEAEKNLSKTESQEIPKIDNVIQLFNDTVAGKGKVKHCRGLSGENIQDYIKTTSYKDFQEIGTWREMFEISSESDFLIGKQSGSSFVVTLNWLVVHDNALKVLNGQYGKGSAEKSFKSNSEPQKVKPLTDKQIELLKAAGQI